MAAQGTSGSKFEVYGFAMMDAGYNFGQIDPAWFDVVRPTKLPAFENQFAPDGNAFFSVRQTRFGVRSTTPTDLGDLKTTFEFELFGTGVDAGQTTLRLRHAYGELGKFGAGQTWSPFMDIDVFPNTVEYWGPTGMAFFRNVQVRYMPIQGDTRMTIALERPGASADQGDVAGRIEIADVKPRFPVPDLSAEYRRATKWGYVELAGIARYIKWEDQGTDGFDLSGDAVGWGLNLSSNVKVGEQNVFRLSALYGEGGLRLLAAPDSALNPYVEATAGIARLTPHVSGFGSGVDGISAAGLQFLRGTDPLIGFGGGILLRGGPVVADLGYRYKQVVGADTLASVLSAGQPLRAHQIRFGIGVRF